MDKSKVIILSGFALLAAVLIGVALFTAEDEFVPATPTEQTADAETPEDPEAPEAPEPVEGSDDLEDTSVKPNVPIPDGDPPEELEIEDIVEGDGDEVQEGDTVEVHYVGVNFAGGDQFDASWDREETTSFSLDGVIPGWSEGMVGMKVGGRRQLIIPPDLAYGDNPDAGPGQPNGTLIFVIDLISIGDPAEDGGDE